MGNATPEPPGLALTRLRIDHGLSARQLAEKAGVSHAAIGRAERGRGVSLAVALALEEVLGPKVRDAVRIWPALPTADTAVAQACRDRNFTVAVAADYCGVSHDVMTRATRGQGIYPENAKKIADAFGLDVSDVLPLPTRKDRDREAA